MLVIYKGYEKEYLEKEIKRSLIANKVEEKIILIHQYMKRYNQKNQVNSYLLYYYP